jgi:hypothetical protein
VHREEIGCDEFVEMLDSVRQALTAYSLFAPIRFPPRPSEPSQTPSSARGAEPDVIISTRSVAQPTTEGN